MMDLFKKYEIIAADHGSELGKPASGVLWYNLYTPAYGEMFLGHFKTIKAAAIEAARLGNVNLISIKVV